MTQALAAQLCTDLEALILSRIKPTPAVANQHSRSPHARPNLNLNLWGFSECGALLLQREVRQLDMALDMAMQFVELFSCLSRCILGMCPVAAYLTDVMLMR